MCMPSYLNRPDVSLLVQVLLYTYTLYMQEVNALAKWCICTGLSEPLLLSQNTLSLSFFSPACDTNLYGPECSMSCGNCVGGEACNHIDGICPSGCEPGWVVGLCSQGMLYVFIIMLHIFYFLAILIKYHVIFCKQCNSVYFHGGNYKIQKKFFYVGFSFYYMY